METMKTLSKLKTEPGIWMEEKPLPEVGHNDILIRISKTAICGTDIHIYNWDEWAQRTIPMPMTIGHEFVGIVEEVGNEVKGIKPGERIVVQGFQKVRSGMKVDPKKKPKGAKDGKSKAEPNQKKPSSDARAS